MTEHQTDVMALWLDSLTYAEAGRKMGVSRQRVEQCVRATGPRWLVSLHLQRCAGRRRLRAHEQDSTPPLTVHTCRVCGHAFWANVGERHLTCSGEHASAWLALKSHVGEYRERQRFLVAKWNSRHADPIRARSAQRHLDGTVGYHGRWLQEGSAPWMWAMEARKQGWPILKELPGPIRRQVAKSSFS